MIQENAPEVTHEFARNFVASYTDPRAIFKVPSDVQEHLASCEECKPAVDRSKAQYQRLAETCCGEPFI